MQATIKRSGKTNQFVVELRDGLDTIRCAVHIDGAAEKSEEELRPLAWAKASALVARLHFFNPAAANPEGS
jgi:hypothetical protein